MQEIRSASARSENDSGMESPVVQWQRISKRVGFQKNWTKECIIKVLNDSEGETLQGKDLQRIPFNANRKKVDVFMHLKPIYIIPMHCLRRGV
jgi:hypothetical protein